MGNLTSRLGHAGSGSGVAAPLVPLHRGLYSVIITSSLRRPVRRLLLAAHGTCHGVPRRCFFFLTSHTLVFSLDASSGLIATVLVHLVLSLIPLTHSLIPHTHLSHSLIPHVPPSHSLIPLSLRRQPIRRASQRCADQLACALSHWI